MILSSKSSQGPRVVGPTKETLGSGTTSGEETITLRMADSSGKLFATKFLPVSELGMILTTPPGTRENAKPPFTVISREKTEHVASEPKFEAKSWKIWQLLVMFRKMTTSWSKEILKELSVKKLDAATTGALKKVKPNEAEAWLPKTVTEDVTAPATKSLEVERPMTMLTNVKDADELSSCSEHDSEPVALQSSCEERVTSGKF